MGIIKTDHAVDDIFIFDEVPVGRVFGDKWFVGRINHFSAVSELALGDLKIKPDGMLSLPYRFYGSRGRRSPQEKQWIRVNFVSGVLVKMVRIAEGVVH